jgi:hypothetical protein
MNRSPPSPFIAAQSRGKRGFTYITRKYSPVTLPVTWDTEPATAIPPDPVPGKPAGPEVWQVMPAETGPQQGVKISIAGMAHRITITALPGQLTPNPNGAAPAGRKHLPESLMPADATGQDRPGAREWVCRPLNPF